MTRGTATVDSNNVERRSLIVRCFRELKKFARGASWTLKHFAMFMLAEAASLEWLRLSSINSFLALYIFGATVVGILLAAGYLSAFPSVQCRLLPPMLVVDPKRFYGPPFEKQPAPAELTRLIENKADQMVLLSTRKLAFPNNESRPLGFMFFDVQTGLARNGRSSGRCANLANS